MLSVSTILSRFFCNKFERIPPEVQKTVKEVQKMLRYWFSLKMISRRINYAKMIFFAESFCRQLNFSFDNPAEWLSPIEQKFAPNWSKNRSLTPKLMKKSTKISKISFSPERFLCTRRMQCRQFCQKNFRQFQNFPLQVPILSKKWKFFYMKFIFALSVDNPVKFFFAISSK